MRRYKTFLRFLICGGLTTSVDFILYFCLTRMGVPLSVAKAISITVSITCSFFLNRSWAFSFQGVTDTKLVARYVVSQVVNMATNTSINYFVLLATNKYFFAFACATLCGMVINYILQRKFVFRGRKE